MASRHVEDVPTLILLSPERITFSILPKATIQGWNEGKSRYEQDLGRRKASNGNFFFKSISFGTGLFYKGV